MVTAFENDDYWWLRCDWSFLSGLPKDERRDRLIVPVQAWIDDSGVKGTDRHLVLAGQIAPAVMWADFSTEWRRALNAPRAIQYFKMHDAARYQGPFTGFSLQERNQKLFDLATVIGKFGFTAIHLTTEIEHFDSVNADGNKPFNHPFFFAAHSLAFSICHELRSTGHARRFELFFDNHDIFGPRIKKWWPMMRMFMVLINPEHDALLPIEPQFRSDVDEMPLQAADMLAWFFRRRAAGTDPDDNQFDWLLPRLFTIPVSEYSTVYDKNGWRARFDETYTRSIIDRVVAFYDDL